MDFKTRKSYSSFHKLSKNIMVSHFNRYWKDKEPSKNIYINSISHIARSRSVNGVTSTYTLTTWFHIPNVPCVSLIVTGVSGLAQIGANLDVFKISCQYILDRRVLKVPALSHLGKSDLIWGQLWHPRIGTIWRTMR